MKHINLPLPADGVLFYFTIDGVEKGHIELAKYDVFESNSKKVDSKDPYSIVLRRVKDDTFGMFEKREIVLIFEEWKSCWPELKEIWMKLINEGIEYSYNKNSKESDNDSNAFSQVYGK